jgi:ATP-dependent exoDNAse (exonuclease V) beta subunit
VPQLQFPDFTLVTASAGAGKTHALSRRYLQLVLSEDVPLSGAGNKLKNILAMTFTNNAAMEMRKRILDTLKSAALGDETILSELSSLTGVAAKNVQSRSREIIASVLDNYSDFQVRTIDSFFASIFTASAVEFGSSPGFEIALNDNTLVTESFNELVKRLSRSSVEAKQLEELVALIENTKGGDDAYLWNPYRKLLEEIRELHAFAGRQTKPLVETPPHQNISALRKQIVAEVDKLDELIERLKLTRSVNYDKYLTTARASDIEGLVNKVPLRRPNVKVPTPARVEAQCAVVNGLVGEYATAIARANFTPYIRAMNMLEQTLVRVGAERHVMFIEQMNKAIAEHLTAEYIPELVVKLGERLNHFLIDEFQDTAPIQWHNISVLVENALAQGGSLYLVGDPKQSIYGFRGGDWQIMERMLQRDEFPSVTTRREPLDKNYRSGGVLVNFVRRVFQDNPNLGDEFAFAASQCGLGNFTQSALPQNESAGYVETHIYKKDEEAPPEQREIIRIVRDCLERGFAKRDVAILARTNKDILLASAWLDAENIQSFSHSSLDVRKRKIAAETISLLRFLDSPIDDLQFANVLLGESFAQCEDAVSREELRALMHEHAQAKDTGPLYTVFREKFPHTWDAYFERLFRLVGYLPLYDLVCELYKTFSLFDHFAGEQAALVKLLDAISALEAKGENSLKAFLEAAGDDEDDSPWNIAAPKDLDAIQLLTIHKSKGLQFPVVVALIRDTTGSHGKTYYVDETPEGLNLLRITEKMAEKNEELKAIREQKLLKDRVDDLNALYVALTRAANELYIVGTHNSDEPKAPTGFFKDLPAAIGTKGTGKKQEPQRERPAALLFESPKTADRIAPQEILSLRETRRGDRIHEIFSHMEFVGANAATDVKEALKKCSPPTGEFSDADLAKTITDFFKAASIGGYFAPAAGRTILIEQDFADAIGALKRADRVVVDSGTVTIIDFKTGHDELHEKYEEQVRLYMRLASAVFAPKTVKGLLAYVDLKKMAVVQ